MAYKHGVYTAEVASAITPMASVDAGLPVVVGCAPAFGSTTVTQDLAPKLALTYEEAVDAMGGFVSADSNGEFEFSLCEFVKSYFVNYGLGQAVLINIFDKNKHIEETLLAAEEAQVNASLEATLTHAGIVESVQLKTAGTPPTYSPVTKFTVTYSATMIPTITCDVASGVAEDDYISVVLRSVTKLELVPVTGQDYGECKVANKCGMHDVYIVSGASSVPAQKDEYEIVSSVQENGHSVAIRSAGSTSTSAVFWAVVGDYDLSKITVDDITNGIAKISEVYPRFRLVPGMLLVPHYSGLASIAAAMDSAVKKINGNYQAIALIDIPSTEFSVGAQSTANTESGGEVVYHHGTTYREAIEAKRNQGFNSTFEIACWPAATLNGERYNMSCVLAGTINQTDAAFSSIPYHTPSNMGAYVSSIVLADGSEIWLDQMKANELNGEGIITVLNTANGFVFWGNRTACYPGNLDVKDNFIPNRRMFNWVANTLIINFFSRVDQPLTQNNVQSVAASADMWIKNLTAVNALISGQVEYRSGENNVQALMDGIVKYHVTMTPPSPMREIDFTLEYDTNAYESALG